MRNARLDEAQAGIKVARRNINSVRYADDTTLMAESEELKNLLMKLKEESEKVDLKLNIQKTKIMAITSWEIDGEIMETVRHFILGGCRWRRRWQPTPVFLPGESQERGSLVGCRLWGRTESDTTEAT